MNIKLLAPICLICFFLGSCDTFSDLFEDVREYFFDNPPVPESKYSANVLWVRELFGNSFLSPLIDGQYGYFSAADRLGGNRLSITKIDLESGRVIWESERIRRLSQNFAPPQKIGEYIYLADDTGNIYVFNDEYGKLAATIRLGNDETAAARNSVRISTQYSRGRIAASAPYLFWGNSTSLAPMGLMRFDSREIDFSMGPYEMQIILPELVWSKEWRPSVSGSIFPDNGIIFFQTHPVSSPHNPVSVSMLVAIMAQTGAILWEKELTEFIEIYPSLVLSGNKLHVIHSSNSCYDKNTGGLLYHNENETQEPVSRVEAFGNFLYYLTDSSYWSYSQEEPEYLRRQVITVLNAETGKREWQTPRVHRVNGATPQVMGEKMYFMDAAGLRVYNKNNNTGNNFIGVDSFFSIYGYSLGFTYMDTLVFLVNVMYNDDPVYLIAVHGG